MTEMSIAAAGQPCALCGSSQSLHVLMGRDQRFATPGRFRVVRCKGCGLMFQDPLPLARDMAGFLEIRLDGWSRSQLYRGWSSWVNARRAQLLCALERPGRLLDIGCGDASFLEQARRRGWEVSGTELSSKACSLARERLGQAIHQGDLPELRFPTHCFDAITLWHVLEHVPEPNRMLSEVGRVLAPGGVVVVEVPNIDNPIFALFGEHYFPLDLPRHVYFYNKATLTAMLSKHGFSIIRKASPSWHYPESIVKSARYRLDGLRAVGDLARRALDMALAPALALATAGYLAASALGAPPEIIRVAATKPLEASGIP